MTVLLLRLKKMCNEFTGILKDMPSHFTGVSKDMPISKLEL